MFLGRLSMFAQLLRQWDLSLVFMFSSTRLEIDFSLLLKPIKVNREFLFLDLMLNRPPFLFKPFKPMFKRFKTAFKIIFMHSHGKFYFYKCHFFLSTSIITSRGGKRKMKGAPRYFKEQLEKCLKLRSFKR